MAILSLNNVSVEFSVYQGGARSIKKALLASSIKRNVVRDSHDRINVNALTDLTFEVRDGDRIGLVGANGAGKSTLLKVLAGILAPTRGRFHSAGYITSLLDIGAGLNTDSTGRENILLRGMYMGIHPREMRKHVDDIVAFTELGPYIDMPVRIYSSGMMVRLLFAISTTIPPEILIMDEWLSAGDAKFLSRAKLRMEAFVQKSSILVLASHSVGLVKEWCNRALLLENGHQKCLGSPDEVIAAYSQSYAAV